MCQRTIRNYTELQKFHHYPTDGTSSLTNALNCNCKNTFCYVVAYDGERLSSKRTPFAILIKFCSKIDSSRTTDAFKIVKMAANVTHIGSQVDGICPKYKDQVVGCYRLIDSF